MTTLREHAERYLAMRRALGFKLTTWGPNSGVMKWAKAKRWPR